MQERQRSWLWYRPGPHVEFRWVSMHWKIMICGTGLDLMLSSGEFPCTVCHTGVGSKGIFCNGCKYLVPKKLVGSSTWQRILITDVHGTRELHAPWTADHRGQSVPDKLEVVAFFRYLGDMLLAAEGCELSTTTHVKTAWKKFKELLPVLSSRHLSFKTWLHVQLFFCRVQCSMPVRLGHWQSQTSNVSSGMTEQWSDRSSMSSHKTLSPSGPMSYLRGLDWGAWPHSEGEKARLARTCGTLHGAVKTACDIQVDGKHGPGRPKMTWKQLTERDCRLQRVETLCYRPSWKTHLEIWYEICHACSKTATCTWKGPTDVDLAPVPAC